MIFRKNRLKEEFFINNINFCYTNEATLSMIYNIPFTEALRNKSI